MGEVTVQRVQQVRDTLIAMVQQSVPTATQSSAHTMFKLISYVGGSTIFMRTHYKDRLKTLMESWELATASEEDMQDHDVEEEEAAENEEADADGETKGVTEDAAQATQI